MALRRQTGGALGGLGGDLFSEKLFTGSLRMPAVQMQSSVDIVNKRKALEIRFLEFLPNFPVSS